MTLDEFEDYINTDAGESHFYEYLSSEYPSSSDDSIIWMMDSGNYVDGFMDHLGVTE